MSASVLVAYTSRSGSTQEVAESIAATLRERELAVTVLPLRDVRTIDAYSAVVIGAPLYMYHWHKDALGFLKRYRQALADRPYAIFALGPAFKGDEEEWTGARAMFDKELAPFDWLKPVARELFGGKFDPKTTTFIMRLFVQSIPAMDLRDWDAIRAWASSLPDKFLVPAA
ncbi:MAG TPA: flavodoxin domain-containing protein [Anaerolineae bacterium]